MVSNEHLWFLFHYLFDVATAPVFGEDFARAWDAYRSVNSIYAQAVTEAGSADAVLVQDYQLMLVGAELRRRKRMRKPLLYFHHTPWCDPGYFSMLPEGVGTEILEGLLAYDVVGFHARRWADAFTACCQRILGATVDGDVVRKGQREARVIVAPVPLDSERLVEEASDERTTEWVARHDELRAGRKLLLRVDRIDLSKNPLRGFLAFEQLLERDPSLVREVVFLALLYPSRLQVETYRRYFTECLGVVRRINERYEAKTPGTEPGPIELHFEDQYLRSLGAMRSCDVMLVNPVFDGLNLVAKESAFVNERDASLVLSRNAGVFEELEPGAIAVNPFDVGATADAIRHALDLDATTRKRNAARLRKLAARSSPMEWVDGQLAAAGI